MYVFILLVLYIFSLSENGLKNRFNLIYIHTHIGNIFLYILLPRFRGFTATKNSKFPPVSKI